MSNFSIIPAIDLFDGQVVRLYKGDYNKLSIYNKNPKAQAIEFFEAGADIIHLVDLNAARSGKFLENFEAITAIIKAIKEISMKKAEKGSERKLKIELGGGIRSWDNLKQSFDLGIDRCVIGTAAVKDPELLIKALKVYGAEKIIVGVDVKDNKVQISGWEEDSSLKASDFLSHLEKLGLKEIIFTDISRDGTLEGPGNAIKQYLETTQLKFILSGGISSLKDLRIILEQREANLIGAITGRAIYEKKIDLKEAVKLCKESK